MQFLLFRWSLLLLLVLAMVTEGSLFGFNWKKMGKSPAKPKEYKYQLETISSQKKKLSPEYINGMLSIQGRMLLNTLNQPSSLKLNRRANSLKTPLQEFYFQRY